MEESNKPKNFETILKDYNKKKPLALYHAAEKLSNIPSKVLKPRDVIATVSKQIKDIQKADFLKKESLRCIGKSGQSNFIPINVLNSQEGFRHENVKKFETQCVTDTQLIDIVENVEAMVNANKNISQNLQRTSSYTRDNSKKKTTEDHTLGLCHDNIVTKSNINKDPLNFEMKNIQNNELCIVEINTDIYKEFDTSYTGRPNGSITVKEDCTIDTSSLEVCLHLEKKKLHGFRAESKSEHNCDLSERKELPSSPILKTLKPIVKSKTLTRTTLSPLIFPLDTFERFESLAMPLIEENRDFEAAKFLINSQITDKQLHISTNSVPTLKNPKDNLILEINISNKKQSENFLNKNVLESNSIVNKSTNIEDQMLFSSDEESDNCLLDLPMTCALQTSFNDSEVDLDKTVFMGFQTSSDKCIQVSKDSFVKAKRLFDSIDKEKNVNLTLTELVDMHDSKVSHFNNNLPLKLVQDRIPTTSENDFVKVSEEVTLCEFKMNDRSVDFEQNEVDTTNYVTVLNSIANKQDFLGFKTASNKNIKISEESLEKSNNIFKDINFDMLLDRDSIKESKLKDCYMNIIDQTLLQEFENESLDETIYKDNKINCNELQMPMDYKETEKDIKKYCISSKVNVDSTSDKDNISHLKENFDPGISAYSNLSDLQDLNKFLGFKTANNKEIKVSNEALYKTKELFHDIGFEDLHSHKIYPDNMWESKKCGVSNHKSFTKNANINNNVSGKSSNVYQLETKDPLPFSLGFKTANNKVVKISKEALQKTEKMFQDIDSFSISKDAVQTKSEKGSKNNVKLLNKHKKIHNPFSNLGFGNSSTTAIEVPKKVTVNSEEKFKGRLNEINEEHICDINSAEMYNTKNCKGVESNIEKVEEVCDFKTESLLEGFKTANNKPVIISQKSLLKTRQIFENFLNIGSDKDVLFENTKCNNLKTEVNKCNKSLGIDNMVRSNFLEFKTASNKKITISEDSLAKTKYVFKDVDCEINNSCNKKENEIADNWKMAVQSVSYNISEIYEVNEARCDDIFTGFQTASNKQVKISDEAIARTRKIFDDINLNVQSSKDEFKSGFFSNECKKNLVKESEKEVPPVFGFKTATNKTIAISEDSLKKSRQIFSDFDDNFKKTNKPLDELKSNKILEIDLKKNINLHNTLDTQLLNNFEETLDTEDFHDSTRKHSKRSSSPILSCPKAKKRKKFETPYRNGAKVHSNEEVLYTTNKKSDVKYNFSQNYKKNKLYILKDLDKNDEIKFSGVIDPRMLNLDFDTLLKFEFEGTRNDITNLRWTTDNIKTYFCESVDHKIIPEGWLDNHLKLIMWKLISYEIRFPHVLQGVFSVKNVLEQLKYRYDKELYRVERPALRKLLEKDEISTRTMVLAVVGVYVDGVKVDCVTSPSQNVELLVTDGWYCVKAATDRMISRLVSEGKIAVGRKIATVGAELLNCEQGISPWEDTSAVRLKLFGNSTRPARWDARLGFYTNGTILSPLSTIDPSGGKVCKTRAVVTRIYPALYVEKFEDGSTVTRSERLEHLHQIKYETERQSQLEKLYEEVEKEFIDQDSPGSEGTDVDFKKSDINGSQLNRLMKECNASQFQSNLTDSQALRAQEYMSRKKEKIVEELQKKVHDKIRAQGLHLGRNVIPLLKIRIAAFEDADSVRISKAMVSIWRPSGAILDVVKEGAWIDMFNVIPTAVRNSDIQISAGRQSVFHRSKYKEKDKLKPYIEALGRKCFTTNDLNKNPTMHTDFNEIDTVGIVFLTEPSLIDFETMRGQQFQNVYLTDVDKNLICINFWGGVKKFGYENIFDTGSVVACMNLQKRAGNTRKNIPQYRATELTVFTKTPKLDHLKNMMEELIKKMSGLARRKFCDDCVLIKNNYATLKQGSEVSPYRFNTSDYNLTKNKMFIDSPLAQTKDLNLNLTGLDFESTFKQADSQELSPAVLKRKLLVKEKIAKLKMYGEPPPLSKIHIVNKSKNAGRSYRSPLTSNVARTDNVDNSPTIANKPIQTSSVMCLDRTFVVRSGVNPVKLNFSATSVGDDKIESNPFEEEFEASPPLSLE